MVFFSFYYILWEFHIIIFDHILNFPQIPSIYTSSPAYIPSCSIIYLLISTIIFESFILEYHICTTSVPLSLCAICQITWFLILIFYAHTYVHMHIYTGTYNLLSPFIFTFLYMCSGLTTWDWTKLNGWKHHTSQTQDRKNQVQTNRDSSYLRTGCHNIRKYSASYQCRVAISSPTQLQRQRTWVQISNGP